MSEDKTDHLCTVLSYPISRAAVCDLFIVQRAQVDLRRVVASGARIDKVGGGGCQCGTGYKLHLQDTFTTQELTQVAIVRAKPRAGATGVLDRCQSSHCHCVISRIALYSCHSAGIDALQHRRHTGATELVRSAAAINVGSKGWIALAT